MAGHSIFAPLSFIFFSVCISKAIGIGILPDNALFDGGPEHFSVKTPKSQKVFNYIWLTTDNPWLLLRIKASRGAQVALCRRPHDTTDDMYDLVIGANDGQNQEITIKRQLGGTVVKRVPTPYILKDGEYRDFWLTWANGTIVVGTGLTFGVDERFRYVDQTPYTINAVSLDTNVNSDVQWQFLRDSARELFLWSRGDDSNSDIWFTANDRKHFTVGVRGKQAAKFGLSDIEGNGNAVNAQTHVIILGSNGRSIIKEQIGGKEVYWVDTPGILDVQEMRYFWVSWESGWIQVGKGLTVGDQMFMSWKPGTPHQIKAVTPFFGTGNKDPQFHFRNVPEDYALLRSQTGYVDRNEHVISMDGRTVFLFRVRACSDALLELKRKYHPANLPGYIRVVLGTNKNQGSKIYFVWENGDINTIYGFSTPDILSCDAFRSFWFSWKGEILRVGTGLVPFQQELFSQFDPWKTASAQTIHLGSGNAPLEVEWQFEWRQGKTLSITTQPMYKYNQAWLTVSERYEFVFKVKAPQGIYVRLATYLGNAVTDMYTVGIGFQSNSWSSIWRDDERSKARKYTTPGILDAYKLRSFWITWSWGFIEAGRGATPGIDRLMLFEDSGGFYPINALTLSSDTVARWEIPQEEEPEFTVYTPTSTTYEVFWMITHREVLPFKLTSCDTVSLALSQVPGVTSTGTAEVTLGDITKIEILGSSSANFTPTKDLLSCTEQRLFWISWYGDAIRVGEDTPPDGQILRLALDNPFPVRAVSLKTSAIKSPEWVFSREVATEIRMATRKEDKYDQLWMNIEGQTSQVFRIKAKESAMILLTATVHLTNQNVYEIAIGQDSNTNTWIRKDMTIPVKQETKAILDPDEFRTFWLSWEGGDIELGSGSHVGVNTIIHWQDTEPIALHALSATSGGSGKVQWEFYRLKDDVYHFTTPTIDKFGSALATTQNDYLSFKTWGCTPVVLGLYEDFDFMHGGLSLFEISIGLDNNSHVAIFRTEEVALVKVAETLYTDVLQCGKAQIFWVSWKNSLIQVGHGEYPHNIILQWDDDRQLVMNLVGFGVGDGSVTAQWEIAQNSVDRLSFKTNGPAYNQFWMTSGSRDHVAFSLSTCSSAHIALTQLAAVTEVTSYEIDIGIGTLRDTLRIRQNGVEKVTKTVPDISSCKGKKDFWVGWRNGTVEVGLGTILGDTSVLSWVDPDPHEVNFIGTASGDDSAAYWDFQAIQGNEYGLNTLAVEAGVLPNYDGFKLVPLQHQSEFFFRVKSCQDVRLALSAHAGVTDSDTYEIVIGGRNVEGEYSLIRNLNSGKVVVNATSEDYLDCQQEREFWVTWGDRHIKVGRGRVGTFEFLEWRMPLDHFTIRALSLTSGTNKAGHWKFRVDEVEWLSVMTSGSGRDDDTFWVSVVGRSSLVLNVRACAEAQIILTDVPYSAELGSYIVYLQPADGKGRLVEYPSGRILDEKKTGKDVLDCQHFRSFWVSWQSGYIGVGSGPLVGHSYLLRSQWSGDYIVTSVGVTTNASVPAEWSFVRSEGPVYRTFSGPDFEYGRSWLSVDVREYISFRVRACANAHLLLTSTSENWFKDTLELVIGSYGNSKVELRYLVAGKPVASKDTPEVLSCVQSRRFWVSWTSGVIQVGSGALQSHVILSWQFREPGSNHPSPFPINAITLTSLGTEAEWELDQFNPSEVCVSSFEWKSSVLEGKSSECPFLGLLEASTRETCSLEACRLGGNVFNFRSHQCNIRRCRPGLLELSDKNGGWDVYASSAAEDTFTANTSMFLSYKQHWIDVIGKTSLVFKVKACYDVHLALAAVPGNSKTMAYEVVIGSWANTQSAIRAQVGDTSGGVTAPTPGVLNCGSLQTLWVSWAGGAISAGQGLIVSERPFITWRSPATMHVVNSVGISTAGGAAGLWKFGDLSEEAPPDNGFKDEVFVMNTDGALDFSKAGWTTSQDYFLFEVQACADVQIILSNAPGIRTKNAYKIILGDSGNYKTTISKIPPDANLDKSFNTEQLLNCSAPLPFWVSSTPTSLTVGRGRAVTDDSAIGTFTDPAMPSLHGVALSTGSNLKGSFVVPKSSGHIFRIVTPNSGEKGQYEYAWVTTANTDHIVFQLKTCNDARILLTGSVNTILNSYEVALGISQGTVSVVRKCPQCANEVREQTPDIVTCDEFRPFWIRWFQGIEVGRGREVGKSTFLQLYEVTSRPVKAISFLTGWGATGEWLFSDIDQASFYMTVAPDSLYNHVWLYEQVSFFQFQLRTCHGATVYIGETPISSDESHHAYEVYLDGSGSTTSYIKRFGSSGDGEIKRNSSTPGLVDCDTFQRLWVSWGNGDVSAGRGELLQDPVIYWHDSFPFTVRTLSLGITKQQTTPGNWQFSSTAAKGIVFTTYATAHMKAEKWVTVEDTDHIRVRVKTCKDAVIKISESVGVSYGYEAVLGSGGNESVLRTPDGTVGHRVPGNPFDCKRGFWFWVSWTDTLLKVGTGTEPDYSTLLQVLIDPTFPGVGAIGFMTLTTDGVWEMSQFEDRVFEVATPPSSSYKHIWMATPLQSVQFKVKACMDATIALAEEPGYSYMTSTRGYEILLGRFGNKGLSILKYTRDNTNQSVVEVVADRNETKGILGCAQYSELWVRWDQGLTANRRHVRVGLGPSLDADLLIDYQDKDAAFPITGVSFATVGDSTGEWAFRDNAARVVRLYTDEYYSYDKVVYRISSMTSFVFSVRAPSDAHIALWEHYHTDKAYEFVIGMSSNTYTAIRNARLEYPVASRYTPGVLNDTMFRQFWVSWTNDRLAIGHGHLVGADEITAWSDSSHVAVQYLTLSTWTGVSGEWEYTQHTLNTLFIETPNDPSTQKMTFSFDENQREFLFDVAACEQAEIRLLNDVGQGVIYEIIIGDDKNTKTKIYKSGTQMVTKNTPDVLDCSRPSKFWVNWEAGRVTLAKGSASGTRLIEWQDPSPGNVHSLTLSTGRGHSGQWTIARAVAPHIRYEALAERRYDGFWLSVTGSGQQVIRVKAKNSVHIILTEIPGVTSLTAYDITIGADLNMATRIRELKSDKELVFQTSPGVLNEDEFRWFWVSWGHYNDSPNGKIKVGHGAVVGTGIITGAAMTEPIRVNGLGVSTSSDKNAIWEFLADTGNVYLTRTTTASFYDHAWLSPWRRTLEFEVAACEDARLLLGSVPGLTNDRYSHEIHLGGWDNTKSAIHRGPNGPVLKSAPGKGLVVCGEMKRFWLGWDKSIQVGEGLPGNEPFLSYTPNSTTLSSLNSVALASAAGPKAEWKIFQNQEKVLNLTTTGNGTYKQHWLTLVGHNSVVFRVKACHSARIILVAIPKNALKLSTEIVIGTPDGRTIIRDGATGKEVDSADTRDVLDCDHYRTFWIQWSLDTVRLGTGAIVWDHSLVSYQNKDLHDILGLSIATGPFKKTETTSKTGQWQFFRLRGNTINTHTPAESDYDALYIQPADPDNLQLTFRVRTCSDASVLLFPLADEDRNDYEIIFGSYSNMVSEILRTGVTVSKASAYKLLSMNDYRAFWINWQRGNLTVGYGEPGRLLALQYYDPNPVKVAAAAISTLNKCDGEWEIDQRGGDNILVHTTGVYSYDNVHLMAMDTHHVIFKVKANHSAHVALCEIPGDVTTLAWEVGIQTGSKNESFLRNGVKTGSKVTTVNTPNFLSSTEFKTFWVSWNDKVLRVGHGDFAGIRQFLYYKHPSLPAFSSVAFATSLFNTGDWQFEVKDRSDDGDTTTTASITPTTTTTTSTSTSTTRSSPTKTPGTKPGTESTTSMSPSVTDDQEVPPSGGLDAGQTVGIVIGVLAGVILLTIVAFLLMMRYKPDSIPAPVSSAVPVSIQNRVRQTHDSSTVAFANKTFNESEATGFGTMDETEFQTDNEQSTT